MKMTSRCKVKEKNWERQTFNLLFLLQHPTIYILSLLKHKRSYRSLWSLGVKTYAIVYATILTDEGQK